MRHAKIFVFDIDGTLANVDHRRHWVMSKPKNWAAFNAAMKFDTPNEDIVFLLECVRNQIDARIVICSGRGSENRAVTEQWLLYNVGYYDALYMRAEKDYRPDSIVKVELLKQIEFDYGKPYLWIDDRDSVVNAIRGQGVRVLQVAPGNF
jgi:phosphoglycolate phosphatase-like HAD superfamily hydrolase